MSVYKYHSTSGRQNEGRKTRICTRSVLLANLAYTKRLFVVAAVLQSHVHVKMLVQGTYHCFHVNEKIYRGIFCVVEKRPNNER